MLDAGIAIPPGWKVRDIVDDRDKYFVHLELLSPGYDQGSKKACKECSSWS